MRAAYGLTPSSFSEIVEGGFVLLVYFGVFVYPWVLIVAAFISWYAYRRSPSPAV